MLATVYLLSCLYSGVLKDHLHDLRIRRIDVSEILKPELVSEDFILGADWIGFSLRDAHSVASNVF